MDEKIREQWEGNAEAFSGLIDGEGTPHHKKILNPCVEKLLGDVKDKQLLDAGCGEGYLSRYYAKKGAIVTAIDLSQRLIETSEQLTENEGVIVDYRVDNGERTMLLRTHTSPVQIRAMERMDAPLRIIVPGKVYRYEASDATHIPMFHQIEGLAIDKDITMAVLKGTLYEFARRFFGQDRKVRFRCDYFPFVEPGIEMAIECLVCNGSGCRLCGNTGWIEILGAGMTHPQVLQRGGIDPEIYGSFAFGIGIDRLPMLRYGIDDIRLFYGSDLRFLRQF